MSRITSFLTAACLLFLTAACLFIAASSVCFADSASGFRIDREASYRASLKLYQYDTKKPLAVKITDTKMFPGCRLQRLSYASTHHQRIPALLFTPTAATKKKPAPCLILLHGLGGNKELMSSFARYAATLGYASLAIDEFGQGERTQNQDAPPSFSQLQTGLIQGVQQTTVDVRRGIDYLATQPNIDRNRIGLVGASLGAMIGTVAAGVDPRIKATVSISGGGDWALILKPLLRRRGDLGGQNPSSWTEEDWQMVDGLLAPEDPLTFAPHIAPRPFLMQAGRRDNIVVPASTQALYDAAHRPANSRVQLDWYESSHIPPPEQIYPVIKAWLAKNL